MTNFLRSPLVQCQINPIKHPLSSFTFCLTVCLLCSVWLLFSLQCHQVLCLWFPKYSDTQKIGCNHSKIWTMWLYHRVMSPNNADGMANSVDLDQSSLIWVYTVCLGISVRKLRIIIVSCYDSKFPYRQAWANSVGAVWSGSTLLAIPSAPFGFITLR